MPRGKAPSFESQRAAILQTAATLFAEKGFASASMADLAEACGVSKALLYHYYRDKAHLLFDTADSYLDTLIAIVAEVRERRLAPMEHFKARVARLMQEYEHAQAQHMVLVQDVKFLGAAEHARIIEKERQVVDAVAQAIAALKPRFRKKAMRVPLAMILFGMINWTFTWLRPDGPLSYDDMSEVVAEIFLGGVATTQQS
jgi:AcrR family transcriptional regulator